MDTYDYDYLAALVEKSRNGSDAAFSELYEATRQKQYAFAVKYLNDKHLAQDAVQDAYILALKNLSKLKNARLFVSWLNQITFHVCFRIKTRQNKYDQVYLDPASFELKNHMDFAPGPEDMAEKADYNAYLRRTIDELPASESIVLKLMYYDNMTIDEIVSLTGMSRSTVKRRLNSGRDRLKSILSQK